MKKKIKPLIIILIILAVIAAGVLTASHFINNMAEEALSDQLESEIVMNGLQDIVSYEEIEVDVLNGKLKLKAVRVIDSESDMDIQADEVFIKISPAEAAAFIMDPEKAVLSKASAGLKEFRMESVNSGDLISIHDLRLSMEGELGQELLEKNEAVLTYMKVDASDIAVYSRESGIDFKAGTLNNSIRGSSSIGLLADEESRFGNSVFNDLNMTVKDAELSMSDYGVGVDFEQLSGNFSGEFEPGHFLDTGSLSGVNNSIQIDFNDAVINLDDSIKSELGFYIGDADLNQLLDALYIENLSFDISSELNKFNVNQLKLDTGFLQADGKAAINTGAGAEGYTFTAELTVEQLLESLKAVIAPFSEAMGMKLPDTGPFIIKASMPEDGMFSLEVRQF